MASLIDAPSREKVRQRLRSELLTDEDFDAFCIDYFPVVAQRLSSGLNRVQKENLLLQMISPPIINKTLSRLNINEHNSKSIKIKIAISFMIAIGVAVIGYRYMNFYQHQSNAQHAQLQLDGGSTLLEKRDPPTATKTLLPLPASSSPSLAEKPSKPAHSKSTPPTTAPRSVQINRIHRNQGNVTIIQNNN